jgi:hypothetical protein
MRFLSSLAALRFRSEAFITGEQRAAIIELLEMNESEIQRLWEGARPWWLMSEREAAQISFALSWSRRIIEFARPVDEEMFGEIKPNLSAKIFCQKMFRHFSQGRS